MHKSNVNYDNCRETDETDGMDTNEADDEEDINKYPHHMHRACHKQTKLYILQQNLFLDDKIKTDELR